MAARRQASLKSSCSHRVCHPCPRQPRPPLAAHRRTFLFHQVIVFSQCTSNKKRDALTGRIGAPWASAASLGGAETSAGLPPPDLPQAPALGCLQRGSGWRQVSVGGRQGVDRAWQTAAACRRTAGSLTIVPINPSASAMQHPPSRTCDSQLGTQGALWINPSACPRQLRLVQRQAGVAALFQVLHGGIHGRQIEDEAAGWAAARSICKGQGIAKCHAT